MLFRLVKKSAQGDFSIRLDGAVIRSVKVGDSHLMEQGFQNRRTDRARHAGERKDVDDAVKAVMGVFQCSANTERSFRANVKAKEAVGIQSAFNPADAVIRLDIQMLPGAPRKPGAGAMPGKAFRFRYPSHFRLTCRSV